MGKFYILVIFIFLLATPTTHAMQPSTKQEYAWFSIGIGIGAFAATVGTYFLHKRTKNKWRQEMVNFESAETAQKDAIKLQLQEKTKEKDKQSAENRTLSAENAQFKTALDALKKTELPQKPTSLSALELAQALEAQEKKAQQEYDKHKALHKKLHQHEQPPAK